MKTQFDEVNAPPTWKPLNPSEKLLIYGIGNVGRQDDGLGIKLIEMLEMISLPSTVSLDANYQLNIEDALLMSNYDVVVFVDASAETGGLMPFSIQPIHPRSEIAFSTHAMSMQGVLSLCEELYERIPRVFLLALPGYSWEISEELSEGAKLNLNLAFQYLMEELKESCA